MASSPPRGSEVTRPSRAYQQSPITMHERDYSGWSAAGTTSEMTSPPPSTHSHSPRSHSYNSFRNVVDAVSSSFRKNGGGGGGGGAATNTRADALPSSQPAHSHAHSHTHSAWQTAPWTQEQFPILDEHMIKTIWRGEDDEDAHLRLCVSKAIEEMQLNWNLDPKLVGSERSEANQGYAAIVAFLQRLAAESAQSDNASGSNILKTTGAGSGGGSTGDDEEIPAGSNTLAQHTGSTARPIKTYERHDLLRAIERQDHETILEIRNANFDLLLDAAPGTSSSSSASSSSNAMQTPLGYAISLGPKFTGTAVVLTGAMSKYVNTLPDEQVFLQSRSRKTGQEFDPRTMERLRKLRGTLKLAVDHSLATDQTQLLSSYVQVLFMSSGTSFITDSITTLCSSLRTCLSSPPGTHACDPVSESREMILQFVNQGLKKRDKVAAVKDLVDNASSDLVLMAAWELIRAQSTSTSSSDADPELSDPLPSYAFARDDRITTLFISRVDSVQAASTGTGTTPLLLRKIVAIKDALQGLERGLRRMDAGERVTVLRNVVK